MYSSACVIVNAPYTVSRLCWEVHIKHIQRRHSVSLNLNTNANPILKPKLYYYRVLGSFSAEFDIYRRRYAPFRVLYGPCIECCYFCFFFYYGKDHWSDTNKWWVDWWLTDTKICIGSIVVHALCKIDVLGCIVLPHCIHIIENIHKTINRKLTITKHLNARLFYSTNSVRLRICFTVIGSSTGYVGHGLLGYKLSK